MQYLFANRKILLRLFLKYICLNVVVVCENIVISSGGLIAIGNWRSLLPWSWQVCDREPRPSCQSSVWICCH